MMHFNFTGRTVLITGAASGMGLAESTMLSQFGAEVWMADVNGVALAEKAEALKAHALELDVTSAESWNAAVTAIESVSGKLDGLVNNAGRSLRKGLLETTVEEWQAILDVNLNSVFLGMKSCHPLLAKGDHPSVVNISSITGKLGYFAPAYGTSKWGVRGLSQAASLELAGQGIRVNSVCPGLVDSPLLNSGSNQFVDSSLRAVPLNRTAGPDEVAHAVVFLLSTASSYITGTDIVVDGGLTSGGTYKQIIDRLDCNS